jgi:hypothetical protein
MLLFAGSWPTSCDIKEGTKPQFSILFWSIVIKIVRNSKKREKTYCFPYNWILAMKSHKVTYQCGWWTWRELLLLGHWGWVQNGQGNPPGGHNNYESKKNCSSWNILKLKLQLHQLVLCDFSKTHSNWMQKRRWYYQHKGVKELILLQLKGHKY